MKSFQIPEGKVKSVRIGGTLVWQAQADTPTKETLIAPTISLYGDILEISTTCPYTEEFVIFVDGVEKAIVINRYHDGGDAG